MAQPKTEPRPDIGYYPAMHPYPGLTACPGCGGLLAWDAQVQAWVTPALGLRHHCTPTQVEAAQAA